MPSTSLIWHDAHACRGASTHVLVIGVGHYAHLVGGGSAVTTYAEGMQQLTSPPVSARAFVGWFVDGNFVNPGKPLGSLALLLSEPADSRITIHEKEIDVVGATSESATEAVRDWFDRCNADPGNFAIMYFCGHGVATGGKMALILRDFGRREANPYAGTIDLMALLTAMETCLASQQVFFVDACRVATGAMLRSSGEVGARPLMADPRRRLGHGAAAQQTYYATTPDGEAYARPDRVSLFTEGVIRGLSGAAAVNEDGEWWTTTGRLLETIDFFVERGRRAAEAMRDRPEVGRQSVMRLNQAQIDQNSVPAYVALDNHGAWSDAVVSYGCGTVTIETLAGTEMVRQGLPDWELYLSPGEYNFEVSWNIDAPYSPYRMKAWVVPPYKRITLRVRQ